MVFTDFLSFYTALTHFMYLQLGFRQIVLMFDVHSLKSKFAYLET